MTDRTLRMVKHYAAITMFLGCAVWAGSLLKDLQPEIMVARAIEREIAR